MTERITDKICQIVAGIMPRKLLYMAVIKAWAMATKRKDKSYGQMTVGNVLEYLEKRVNHDKSN